VNTVNSGSATEAGSVETVGSAATGSAATGTGAVTSGTSGSSTVTGIFKGSKGKSNSKGNKGKSTSKGSSKAKGPSKSRSGGKATSKAGKSGKGKSNGSVSSNAGSSTFHSGSSSANNRRQLGTPSCQKIPVFFYVEDLKSGYNATSVGGSFHKVPFYYKDNGDLLGYYSDSSTKFADGDCVGVGTFSFGKTSPYPSQVSVQFTCTGHQNSIIGGNGDFGCASGVEVFTYDDGVSTESELLICKELCPFKQLAQ
jgi:hypothetical protein